VQNSAGPDRNPTTRKSLLGKTIKQVASDAEASASGLVNAAREVGKTKD